MGEAINSGAFLVARKIYDSAIWWKPPLYVKVWLWILGQCNYRDTEKNGRTYKRGELITTHDKIIKAVSHYYNRAHIFPSIKQIRKILDWLASEGMITVEPLIKSGLGQTGADPTADTRAYLGIKIIVIKYEPYQTLKNYRGRHQGRLTSELGHNIKEVKERNNNADSRISALISFFRDEVLSLKGWKPKVNYGASGKAIKTALEEMTEDEVKEVITFYIKSPKAKKCGITLTAALSPHSINFYRDNKEKKDWQQITQ